MTSKKKKDRLQSIREAAERRAERHDEEHHDALPVDEHNPVAGSLKEHFEGEPKHPTVDWSKIGDAVDHTAH